MAMAFTDNGFAIGGCNLCSRLELCVIRAEAHGAALFSDVSLINHQVDNWILCCRIKLCRVRVGETKHVTSKFNGHDLHS